jgi:hypothetical protein
VRNITIDCEQCGARLPLDQGKEVLIKTGDNDFHLMDLCAKCLDTQLQNSESVNDADGFRQQAAALITLKDGAAPERRAAS